MAKIFSVSNSEELKNALASATGGDTIELAGGDYGLLKLNKWSHDFINYETPITITSSDPDAPATFSEIDFFGASNITIDNVTFDYKFSEDDPAWHSPFKVANSENITIKNSVFVGDVASGLAEDINGLGYASGLNVTDSSNIKIENNEFSEFAAGTVFIRSDNLSIIGNEIYDVRQEGMNFAQVNSVLIEDNHIHDFDGRYGWTDHRDMIQFWTNSTDEPSYDITIRDNVFDVGEGSLTQTVFMRNEAVDGGAGFDMYYRDILIENNTIYNVHSHGITVGQTDGLTIRNNSLFFVENDRAALDGTPTSLPQINVHKDSASVVVENNISRNVNGFVGQDDWVVTNNINIDPKEYIENFITSTLNPQNGEHGFSVIPDTMIEQLSVGSESIRFSDAPDTLTPQAMVYSDPEASTALILDASLTAGPMGVVSDSDAEFHWSFGDGTTATGQIVKHDFTSAGHHDVTLTVVTNEGTIAQAQFTADMIGDEILQFDAQAGLFETLAFGEETALDGPGLPLEKTATDYALKLGGEGSQASILWPDLSRFFGTDNFEMSMSLKADNANSFGELSRVHLSFVTLVKDDGNFRVILHVNDNDVIDLSTSGIDLTDGAQHDVVVRFNGVDGVFEIEVDGTIAASETVFGALTGGQRSLDFGNPWGQKNFDGELSAFSLSTDSRDLLIYDGETLPSSSTGKSTSEPDAAPESDPAAAEPVEEPAAEEPVEEPAAEEPVEEPAAEEPVEEPAAEEPVEEPAAEEPVEEPAAEEPVEEPAAEEESSLPELLLNGGYQLDFASIATSDTVQLHGDAHLVETEGVLALSFDGKKDFVSLGRLTQFETSQKIAFSVDFVSDNSDGGTERLVWNHEKVGLTLKGDGMLIHVQNKDGKFHQGFQVDGLGLNDGNLHNATVMVDAETDQLQVVVNDVLVLDEQDIDFDFVGAGRYESGWSLGVARNGQLEGEVYEFQVSDDFTFIETQMDNGNIF